MYKIDKNIPPPKQQLSHLFPIPILKVGESFLVPKTNTTKVCIHLNNYWKKISKYKNYKFTTRRDGKNVRVWRIK